MGRNVCKTCDVSAVCFARGFDVLYAERFKVRLRSTYIVTRIPEDRTPVEAHRLRIAVNNTAAQAACTFPADCPEKPHSVDPVVEEFEKGSTWRNKKTKIRVGNVMFEVSLG